MFQHEGVSFAKSFMKMKADGTLQSIISDGFRSKEDERGEKHFQ